ncbi:hypothetical protein QNH20_07900 [Neobacillus sp. WH10]|uniref:hypothetical protein n=1 Tax=Neobacillus sp. WH10 TaxID=3047873 RepID=UPI0024C18B9D|nr:hypothetical protein [Neobacillus sp. WH10]WHY79041.1 hypothetical protein QNH20_07900 [Neobacillus sp. WH10]
MNVENCSLVIDDELLEKFDFEGMLVNALNPELGMLVMSGKDDTFTLHIYMLQSQSEFEYHVDRKLTTKTFSSLVGMQYFLNKFSNYKASEFMDFVQKYTQTH